MKNALIDPNATVVQIVGWESNPNSPPPYFPIYEEIPNAERVAEVLDTTFPVSLPLFWMDCPDNVVADQWYYNSATGEFVQIPPAPPLPSGVGSV